jgi:hypothetical protein
MVGVLLARKLPDGTEDRTEIAVDFACNSVIAVREQDHRRVATASFFDASRPRLLSIVQRALPTDEELARLR